MTTNRRIFLSGLTGAALAAALPVSAFAHREKTTLTQIIWNKNARLLEVTHSYHTHDAETALAHIGVIERPDLTSLIARARLALYTEANFDLKDEAGEKIPLELIGADIEGRYVYVFQQVTLDAPPESVTVDCRLLRDIIEGQINNVDYKVADAVHSLLFRGDDRAKKVRG